VKAHFAFAREVLIVKHLFALSQTPPYPLAKTLLEIYAYSRLYGSAVLRTSIFAILTALETILLYNFIPRSRIDAFYVSGRPYLTIPALAATTSLLIVFRQQVRGS
jgi:hypothetical protein